MLVDVANLVGLHCRGDRRVQVRVISNYPVKLRTIVKQAAANKSTWVNRTISSRGRPSSSIQFSFGKVVRIYLPEMSLEILRS
jgi:hypothetical protein